LTAGSAARAGSQWAGAFTRSESLRGWTLLSPTVIVMVAGLAAPLLIMLLYSFWKQDGPVLDTALTTANYQYAITKYWPIFLRSLWISALVTAVTVLLAYPIAYYVAFHVKSYKFIWLILLTIPFWTSYLLRVFAWRIILARDGVINGTLQATGVIDQPISWLLFSNFAIVLTLAHAWAAFAILPIYVSLEKVDRTLLEAGADLGDGPVRSFWRITFPLSLSGVISAVTLVFVPTIGDYVTPDLVGGPTGGMIAKMVYNSFKGNDWPLAAATAILSMIFVASVAFLVIQLLRKSIVDPVGALVIAAAVAASIYFASLALGLVRANAPEGTPAVAVVLLMAVLFVAGVYYTVAALRAALGRR
jgi:spermidine/putrescine transport system permease protein